MKLLFPETSQCNVTLPSEKTPDDSSETQNNPVLFLCDGEGKINGELMPYLSLFWTPPVCPMGRGYGEPGPFGKGGPVK